MADQNEASQAAPQPRCLLSLDGGGTKGLTSLLILRRLMHLLMVEGNLQTLPKPCECFDLIGGTSTGGLIAILLGRLELGIDECIEIYKTLARRVFVKQVGRLQSITRALRKKTWFNSKSLEDVCKLVISQACGDENEPLLGNGRCKIFVCAIRSHSLHYELLRSYTSAEEDHKCYLWEAARATTAAPLYFEPVVFENSRAVFVDGALRINNPVRELVNEATKIWPGDPVCCLVSIGTGFESTSHLTGGLTSNLKSLIRISTDAQQEAERFVRDTQGRSLMEDKRYFRFNVEQGIQGVRLQDSSERDIEILDSRTKAYLDRTSISMELKECVKAMQDNTTTGYCSSAQVHPGPSADVTALIKALLNPIDFSNRLSQMRFDRCPGTGDWATAALQSHENSNSEASVFWLNGKPGCGKTFLMFAIHEFIQARQVNDRAVKVLHYYFNGRARLSRMQELDTVKRTLIAQGMLQVLGESRRVVEQELNTLKFYQDNNEEEDAIPDWLFCQVIRHLFGENDHTYVLIDGIDECPHSSALLRLLNRRRLPFARFIFGSRNLDTLRELIIGTGQSTAKTEVRVEDNLLSHGRDIEAFIRLRMQDSNVKDLGSSDTAFNTLLRGSAGLFLMAKLRFEALDKTPRSGAELQRAVNDLPADLTVYYGQTLGLVRHLSVRTRELTRNMFLWVAYAQRDLKFEELAEALAIAMGVQPSLPESLITAKWIDDISGGLLVLHGIEQHIEFAHVTIKEFVLEYDWGEGISQLLLSDERVCHYAIMSVLQEILSGRPSQWILEVDHTSSSPLLDYAVQFWASHLTQLTTDDRQGGLMLRINDFMQSRGCLLWWADARRYFTTDEDCWLLQTQIRGWSYDLEGEVPWQNCPTRPDNLIIRMQEDLLTEVETVKGSSSDLTLTLMSELSATYRQASQWQKALTLDEKLLTSYQAQQGDFHPSTISALSNLAMDYSHRGLFSAAESMATSALDRRVRVLGEQHPDTINSMARLAEIHEEQGLWVETEKVQRRIMAQRLSLFGPTNLSFLWTKLKLAEVIWKEGRWNEAAELELEVLDSMQQTFGDAHPLTLKSKAHLGATFRSLGRLEEADKLVATALQESVRVLGQEHTETLNTMAILALIYSDLGRLKEAEVLQRSELEICSKLHGAEHPETMASATNLAGILLSAKKFEAAEEVQSTVLRVQERDLGLEHQYTLKSSKRYATILWHLGREDEALRIAERVSPLFTSVFGAEHPESFTVAQMLHSWRSAS